MKIKAIIFDLDDTLLDTTGLLIPIARTPAFEKRIREPLPLMIGAKENLEILSKKYQLFLLTYGRPEAQKAKVESLGIQNYFNALYFADPAKSEVKFDYFKKIPKEHNLDPAEVLSIGNRRKTDIGEAKQNGLKTCHFVYGEHQDEVAESEFDHPDFTVHNHSEILTKCQLN